MKGWEMFQNKNRIWKIWQGLQIAATKHTYDKGREKNYLLCEETFQKFRA